VEYEEAGEDEELKFKNTDNAARVNIAEENDDESVEKEESEDLDIEDEYPENEKIKVRFFCFCAGQY
jgi:hypothetical protein